MRLFVSWARLRSLARAHETMAGALVSHGLVSLARLLHQFLALLDGCGHARVVAAVKAIHRATDALDRLFFLRARAVENERCFQILVVGGIAKALSAAPAITGDNEL